MSYFISHIYARDTSDAQAALSQNISWRELSYKVGALGNDKLLVIRFYDGRQTPDKIVVGEYDEKHPAIDIFSPAEVADHLAIQYPLDVRLSPSFTQYVQALACDFNIVIAHYYSEADGGTVGLQCAWLFGNQPGFVIEDEFGLCQFYSRSQGSRKLDCSAIDYFSQELKVRPDSFRDTVHNARFKWPNVVG